MRKAILIEYVGLITLAVLGIVVVFFVHDSPFLLAFFTFAAVVSAAMVIAWAAEAAQFSISQGLALAIVAIVQTLPEFFVEGTIAWQAGRPPVNTSLVIANFTGANRLLTGLGWPLILFTAEVQRRRFHQSGPSTITLRKEQSIEVVFMLAASFYYILIILKGTLTLVDAGILLGGFLVYLWVLSKLRSEDEKPEEVLEGAPLSIVQLRRTSHRATVILGLFLFSALVFVFISEPFVNSIKTLAVIFLGVGAEFFFIQWIAPLLSEFPEKVTAFNWARKIKLAPMALLNFISSSVNELTALVAVIPVVFTLSRGVIEPVPVSEHTVEILLTMAQSLYACAALLDLEYDFRNAAILFGLWLVSTVLIEYRLAVSVLFLVLAGIEVALHRGRTIAFSSFKETLREHVWK